MPESLFHPTVRFFPAPPQPAHRHYRERETLGKYIRRRDPSSFYQVCIWISAKRIAPQVYDRYRTESPAMHGFSINCGFFLGTRDAQKALAAILKLIPEQPNPLDVWRATSKLQDDNIIPIGRRGRILPLWVRVRDDKFVGIYRKGCEDEFRTKPYDSPELAHAMIWEHLTQT